MNYEKKSRQFVDDEDKKSPVRDALKVEIELSDHLRKMSRNLLFCLLASFAIVVMGFEPTKLSSIGIDFASGKGWSVPWAIFFLAMVFAGLGFESWQDARNSFTARIKLRKAEIPFVKQRICDAIEGHHALATLGQKSNWVDKSLKLTSPESSQVDKIVLAMQEKKLSDHEIKSFQQAADTLVQQNEDLDSVVRKWPAWQCFQRTVHIVIPAVVPVLCLALAAWDSWAGEAAQEPSNSCIGQYESDGS